MKRSYSSSLELTIIHWPPGDTQAELIAGPHVVYELNRSCQLPLVENSEGCGVHGDKFKAAWDGKAAPFCHTSTRSLDVLGNNRFRSHARL